MHGACGLFKVLAAFLHLRADFSVPQYRGRARESYRGSEAGN